MAETKYNILPLSIPDDSGKVMLEYVMMNYSRLEMLTKTYVVNFNPRSVDECPIRAIFEFDSAALEYPSPEINMVPVAMCRDPFRQGSHKIVLCEAEYADGRNKDIEFNTRKQFRHVLEKVTEFEPWYGIEQEFYITDKNDIPLGWKMYEPGIDICTEMFKGEYVGFERQFVDLHLRACLYAGLEMYGCVREMNPSQWEFQVGPLPGIHTADHVILARYILFRLAEMHDVKVSFRNVGCGRHTNARQTFHLNFSTKHTRAEGGIKDIYKIIESVSRVPQEAMFKHYDLSNGEEMKWYLDGDLYMPEYNKFHWDVGSKYKTSLRIPTHVFREGKGYVEERRPVSSADPYDVCRVFTMAALYEQIGLPREP